MQGKSARRNVACVCVNNVSKDNIKTTDTHIEIEPAATLTFTLTDYTKIVLLKTQIKAILV